LIVKERYDVVIIGGAVMGSATAYFLVSNPAFDGSVLVVERDPSYSKSSTALSSGSIRNQFSSPVNVRIGQFGVAFIRAFAETMEVDGSRPELHFHESGYLFLAATNEQAAALRENHDVQRALGVDVELLLPSDLQAAFPHLRVNDLKLASYGRSGEGWFSATALMDGFRKKARQLGADLLVDEVVGIGRRGNRVTEVSLKSGSRIPCGFIVNATGPRAARTSEMAGLIVPVEARKRTTFLFDCANSPEGSANVNNGRLPLMIDPSGTYCRPDGRLFMAGTNPASDPPVDFDDFEPRHEEFDRIWTHLAKRSRGFEAIKMAGMWAGHYDFNALDQNAIVGPHSVVSNFIFANGFSGHGLQQSPAVGRGISELIAYGRYRTLDLGALGHERFAMGEPLPEKAVI